MEGFELGIPQIPESVRLMTFQQAEQFLLKRLKDQGGADEAALWELARLYQQANLLDESQRYVDRLLEVTTDVERKAQLVLALGQLMERRENYQAAITFYSRALSLEPNDTGTGYFIHNNLAYCLNHFGRFAEAEKECRAAIRIDPTRPNGFKNLGIALEGQGRFADAAKAFVQAVRVNASDPRALRHFEKLLAEHTDLSAEVPNIEDELRACREAVRLARDMRARIMRAIPRAQSPPEEPRGPSSASP